MTLTRTAESVLDQVDLADPQFLADPGHHRVFRMLRDHAPLHGNPEQWQRLREDRVLLNPTVGEVLRYVSPSRHVLRRAERDVDLHGRRMWASLATMELRLFLDELCERVGSATMIEPPARLASTVISGFKHLRVQLLPA
ncbi:hypothetical protein AB0A69_10235 [Streptomyces sp. NPDC045431]|uniref:hypothetical protein n=1 Tax=Streptomyces sp. NPDC045431 TaxID=3155613 RepID=UPI0033DF84F9